MSGINKIPIKNLLLHISNVINACDLSSVTSCGVKEYLKHKFKDALPSENDLDMILENVIKSVKLSQALNGDSVHFKEGNYDSLDTYKAFVENEIKDHDKPIKKRFLRKIGVCYVLKKGVDPNAGKAYSYSVKNPVTSKTIRIIKPYLNNKKRTKKQSSKKKMSGNPMWVVRTEEELKIRLIKSSVHKRTKKQPSKKKMSSNPMCVVGTKGGLKICLIKSSLVKKPIEVVEEKTLPRKNVKPIEVVEEKTLPRKNVKPIEVVEKKTLPRKNVALLDGYQVSISESAMKNKRSCQS